MSIPIFKVILYKSKIYADGTSPIMVRITKDGKRSYEGVGYSVSENAWDTENCQVYTKKPQITKRQEGQLNSYKLSLLQQLYKNAIVLANAEVINAAIQDKLEMLSDVTQRLKLNKENLDSSNVKRQLKKSQNSEQKKLFFPFAETYRDQYLKSDSVGTYKNYKTILNKLKKYVGNERLTFTEITVEFLRDYHSYLISNNNNGNTIHNNLKSIRAIFKEAVAQRIITPDLNPFLIFKVKTQNPVKKEKLTIEEIKSLEKLDLEERSLLQHCLKFFLCSFYCAGIRASDMLLLKWSNVLKNDRLEYRMEKTGTLKSIMLIPKAKAILDSYRNKSKPTDFVFPFLDGVDVTDSKTVFNRISSSTALINKYLKQIAKQANVEKNLSTHIARHSFSDIARKKKASIYDISKMLGHSSIKITEAYLASLDIDSQDETMTKILDF